MTVENDSTLVPLQGSPLREVALVEEGGEPRARDIDIAERLGLARPRNIRKLIENNRQELEAFGPIPLLRGAKSGAGRPEEGYLLNEEQSLLVATLSSAPNAPAVRAMLIRTFVVWRRGHLEHASFDMRAVGGMVKRILAKQLHELVPALVREEVASQQHAVIHGVSAGQVIEMAGIGERKGLRGLARFASNRLRRFHAARGVAVKIASLGSSQAYVFDPATSREWLANGGKVELQSKAAERRGQGALRLV
ncbi:hypothetical protein PUR23_07210 [Methylorubrum populi]|uniref:Uncharacterized protein n=1 Tax=Methylorubrum populi (strain ATCC BAA-705 / NCIMB 13946 / BJ001) TaxID=441620 RepID=B1ZDH0_METPB|nr:hypothetical protein [Methylorubrum populi]ACB79513.1 hypothetical protein Mpop_1343 [Methylorubrum populi BJ001]OAH36887.1 hypothetical protein AX289_29285 [Methylorubrum populi]PZP65665.1 MAG: hypothetical protein DI590_26520 [Methylorubrum populi]